MAVKMNSKVKEFISLKLALSLFLCGLAWADESVLAGMREPRSAGWLQQGETQVMWPDSLNVRFVGTWPFGPSQAIAYDSLRTLAFCGSGAGGYVLDISDPSLPVKLSEQSTPAASSRGSSIKRTDYTFTYSLIQNYPNPFNTSTEIRYQVPEDDHVTLKIFNTLAQEVQTLVDTQQKPGEYRVIWNGQDENGHEIASGLYFCRLNAGVFNKTTKMVLIR
jgi:hypothetical protein